MIVDGKAGPGSAGGDTIAKEIEDGVRNKGIKALVVRVDSPGGSVLASERIRQALLDAKAQQDPDRRVDGQRRRLRRLLGLDPGRFHLRRALDHHRLDRRVRRAAELPGHAAEARRRRRRREDHAAGGRAGPAQGPSPEANQLSKPASRRCTAASSGSSRQRGTRPRSRSTRSLRAGCGTAAPRTRSGSSTASAECSDAIAKAAQLANLGDERGVRYLEPPAGFRDQLIDTLASDRHDDSAGRRTPSRLPPASRSASSPR